MIIGILSLGLLTYLRTCWSDFISDDITTQARKKKENWPLHFRDVLDCPNGFLSDLVWKTFKGRPPLHHILSIVLYNCLLVSFYIVAQRYIPRNIAFLAALIFAVHPCNAQIGGWISGRWYALGLILGLWALYFNNVLLYLIGGLFTPVLLPLPLLMKVDWFVKALAMAVYLLMLYRGLVTKEKQIGGEGAYKADNLRFYPRKIVVAIKSFCYNFTLILLPLKQGWFHEIGEPINEELKSINRHFVLCLALLGVLACFRGSGGFIGLGIFCLFIAPFSNFVTIALFTSERYMTPAVMGMAIFLAYNLINYPIAAAVLITVYFMRTQLELLAYRDDFSLALYSLFNFDRSGFAWANLANYFLFSKRPQAAYDLLQEAVKKCPEFPTIYYQLYLMYRAVDLKWTDYNKALEHLEKACHYGKHESWHKELVEFKRVLKAERIKKFKENNAPKYPTIGQFRPIAQPVAPDFGAALVGATA